MIPEGHRTNFETLLRAFEGGDVCLVECRRRSDGAVVAMLTAVGWEDGQHTFTPFAEMVNGSPYELYDPPDPEGGFHTARED